MLFLREDPHIVIGSRTLSDVRLLMRGPGTDSEAPEGTRSLGAILVWSLTICSRGYSY
jgi:hypothetical protein